MKTIKKILKPNVEKLKAKGDIKGLMKALLWGQINTSYVRIEAKSALDSLGYEPEIDELGAIYWVVNRNTEKCVECGELAVGPLITRLNNYDSYGQPWAAEVLGKIGGTKAVKALISILRRHHFPSLRKKAADVLGEIGDSRAVRPLIVSLKEKQERRNPKYRDYYIGAIENERINIARALGKIGDARAVEPLIAVLEDYGPEVRVAAAHALAKIGDARAVEPLIAIIKASSWPDQEKAAVEALGRIGDTRAVEPLIAILNYIEHKRITKECKIRDTAAEALGRIGDSRAVEPLIAALRDRRPIVRESVVKALGQIGDARAVEPLKDTFKDANENVRKAAAEALKNIQK